MVFRNVGDDRVVGVKMEKGLVALIGLNDPRAGAEADVSQCRRLRGRYSPCLVAFDPVQDGRPAINRRVHSPFDSAFGIAQGRQTLEIDTAKKSAAVNGKPIKLTALEYSLVEYLYSA